MAGATPIHTPDRRYVVVEGQLWRAANPHLPVQEQQRLVAELMAARRAVQAALKLSNKSAERLARGRVHQAKVGLGERGPVWWNDGAPDYNRRKVQNTPYAAWYAASRTDRTDRKETAMTYVDGFLLAVPKEKKDAYRTAAEKGWTMFKEWGAIRQVECWSDDVQHGHTTDFFRAVKAEENEVVVFSWIEYPSKQVRDAANEKMKADPRMKEWGDLINFVDGKRMVFGGFTPIFDSSNS